MSATASAPRARTHADPASGARRIGDPARRVLRMLLPALLAALVLVFPSGPAAHAADPTPAPSPSATLSGTVERVLSPTSNGIHRPGQPLTLWAAVHNGTVLAVPATTVEVSVGSAPVADRAALAAWLAGTGQEPGFTPVATGVIDAVDTGQDGQTLLTASGADPALQALNAPGVYPLQASFTTPAGTQTARSVLVVPPSDAAAHTPVAVIVPITAPGIATGLLTARQLQTLTSPTGDLTAALNAVAGTSAILAVDPAIPAAVRALGTAAPASATAWLQRLEDLPNERFALQFGDADVAAQTRSGLAALLQPQSLSAYLSADDFPATAPAPTPTPTPVATVTPSPAATAQGGPALPSLATLLGVGEDAATGLVWPVTGTAGPADVTALGGMSVDGSPAVTLVPSAQTTAGADSAAVPAHGTDGAAAVLVYDSAVSDALRAASTQDDPSVRGRSLAAASAYLQLASAQLGDAPLLTVVDRDTARTALGLSAAVSAVDQSPTSAPAQLETLSTAPAHEVAVTDPSDADAARVAAVPVFTRGEAQLAAFATVLADPTLITGAERAEVLQLLGSGWRTEAADWPQALADHGEQTQRTLASVSIAPTSTINLAGTSAPLRFGVRNDLPWPVQVTLLAHPDSLRVEVQPRTEVAAHADSTTRVSVPVQARIGSGPVTIGLQLVSPTGVAIGQPHPVEVNVHADWEIIGLSVLGVGVAAFLALGVVRTVRARRARANAPDAGDGDDGDADDGAKGAGGTA